MLRLIRFSSLILLKFFVQSPELERNSRSWKIPSSPSQTNRSYPTPQKTNFKQTHIAQWGFHILFIQVATLTSFCSRLCSAGLQHLSHINKWNLPVTRSWNQPKARQRRREAVAVARRGGELCAVSKAGRQRGGSSSMVVDACKGGGMVGVRWVVVRFGGFGAGAGRHVQGLAAGVGGCWVAI